MCPLLDELREAHAVLRQQNHYPQAGGQSRAQNQKTGTFHDDTSLQARHLVEGAAQPGCY